MIRCFNKKIEIIAINKNWTFEKKAAEGRVNDLKDVAFSPFESIKT